MKYLRSFVTHKTDEGPPPVAIEACTNLEGLVSFDLGGEATPRGAYLTTPKGKRSPIRLVFGFRLGGLHILQDEAQLHRQIDALEQGFASWPEGERLTIHYRLNRDDEERQAYLNPLLKQAPSDAIKLSLASAKRCAQQLKQTGQRQRCTITAFVTVTLSSTGSDENDGLASLLHRGFQTLPWKTEDTVAHHLHQQLLRSFKHLKQRERLLTRTMELEVYPLSLEVMWAHLNRRFANPKPGPVPQYLTVTASGIDEYINDPLDPKHPLFHCVNNGVPEANASYVRLGNPHDHPQYVAPIAVVGKPAAWRTPQLFLHGLWMTLLEQGVHDIEVVSQITPASRSLTRIDLERRAREGAATAERSLQQNTIDPMAERRAEESVEALEQLEVDGDRPVHLGMVILVSRPSLEALSQDVPPLVSLLNKQMTAEWESHCAPILWKQTLPTCWGHLLKIGGFNKRRSYFASEIAAMVPLSTVQSLDETGFELLSAAGGLPIHLDVSLSHLLLTATTRGGKSVMSAALLMESLARGTPVCIADYPGPDGRSTFSDYSDVLGIGRYIDISKSGYNLLEFLDLREVEEPEQRRSREQQWANGVITTLLILVVGSEPPDIMHAQAVRDVLTLALSDFCDDHDMRTLHQQALTGGPDSPAWMRMPTLYHFVDRFCSEALLTRHQLTGEAAQKALAQIRRRLQASFNRPIGRALATISNEPTDPLLMVYALTDLADPEDAAVMASVVLTAVQRQALQRKGRNGVTVLLEEAPVLFRFPAISQLVGSLVSNGLKWNCRVMISSQTPEAIANSVAGQQILQNLAIKLTGAITLSAVESFTRHLSYPEALIRENTTAQYRPNKKELYSQWLVDNQGRFAQTRFYPSEVLLALCANNPLESRARAAFMAKTSGSPLEKLAAFAKRYSHALRNDIPLTTAFEAYLEP